MAKSKGPPLKKISDMRGLGAAMMFAMDTESIPGKAILHMVRFETIVLNNDATFDQTSIKIIHRDNDRRLEHLEGCFIG